MALVLKLLFSCFFSKQHDPSTTLVNLFSKLVCCLPPYILLFFPFLAPLKLLHILLDSKDKHWTQYSIMITKKQCKVASLHLASCQVNTSWYPIPSPLLITLSSKAFIQCLCEEPACKCIKRNLDAHQFP
jgi:hypothetical protein